VSRNDLAIEGKQPMRQGTQSKSQDTQQPCIERALDLVRHQTVRLACAISGMRYLSAWLEACELQRELQRARVIASAHQDPDARAHALERVEALEPVVAHLLANAPAPSQLAVRQARSPDWSSDRSAWFREEQAWIDRMNQQAHRLAAIALAPLPSAVPVTCPLDEPTGSPERTSRRG